MPLQRPGSSGHARVAAAWGLGAIWWPPLAPLLSQPGQEPAPKAGTCLWHASPGLLRSLGIAKLCPSVSVTMAYCSLRCFHFFSEWMLLSPTLFIHFPTLPASEPLWSHKLQQQTEEVLSFIQLTDKGGRREKEKVISHNKTLVQFHLFWQIIKAKGYPSLYETFSFYILKLLLLKHFHQNY